MPFVKGNPGGPGRPRKSVEEKYLKKFSSSVTLTEWREIIKKAVQQAQKGDARARQWLADYLVGKPIQAIDLEHDGEIRFLVEYADGLHNNPTETP